MFLTYEELVPLSPESFASKPEIEIMESVGEPDNSKIAYSLSYSSSTSSGTGSSIEMYRRGSSCSSSRLTQDDPQQSGLFVHARILRKTLHTDASKPLARKTNVPLLVVPHVFKDYIIISLNKSPELSVYPNLDYNKIPTRLSFDRSDIIIGKLLVVCVFYCCSGPPALFGHAGFTRGAKGFHQNAFISLRLSETLQKIPIRLRFVSFVYHFQKREKHILYIMIRRKNRYHMTYYC